MGLWCRSLSLLVTVSLTSPVLSPLFPPKTWQKGHGLPLRTPAHAELRDVCVHFCSRENVVVVLFLRMERSKQKISLVGYTANLILHLNLTLCLS